MPWQKDSEDKYDMGKIYVVGIGPGDEEYITKQAAEALEESDVIVGYDAYVKLVKDRYPDKDYYVSGMRRELERCEKSLEYAKSGKTVALVCSGDAGVYGMASPLLELAGKEDFAEVEIVPGITAAISGASVLGAPIGHDFCVISLSDLLTPWELIEKRIRCAAVGDFCMVIYNPSSHKRKDYLKRACNIMLTEMSPETICGYVRNIGRDKTEYKICTLKELADEQVDMFVTVFIGNSNTKIENGRMITPRGYNKQ